jgi:hypothetical protein
MSASFSKNAVCARARTSVHGVNSVNRGGDAWSRLMNSVDGLCRSVDTPEVRIVSDPCTPRGQGGTRTRLGGTPSDRTVFLKVG